MNFNQKTYVFETKNICFFFFVVRKEIFISRNLPVHTSENTRKTKQPYQKISDKNLLN